MRHWMKPHGLKIACVFWGEEQPHQTWLCDSERAKRSPPPPLPQVARDDVNTVVVTNDLMRDHRSFFPGTREFVRWKRSHHVSFAFAHAEDTG